MRAVRDVFGVGTAVVDYFARGGDALLDGLRLIRGASNYTSRERLDAIHARVRKKIFSCYPGDNARNLCEGVRALGGRAAYASGIGDDTEGKIFIKNLRALGIESFLSLLKGSTGKIITFITPDHERTFAVSLGNTVDYDAIPENELARSKFFYLTSITALCDGKLARASVEAMKFCRKRCVRVALSLESAPMVEARREKIMKLLEYVDVLFANENEARALVGDLDRIAGACDVVFLKMGARGSVVFHRGWRFDIPAYEAEVVDTTGAGDFYAAGAIYGLALGAGAEKAGRIGSYVAARAVEGAGARVGRINKKLVERLARE
ncbi:MAG: adenosine kinase [Candidatus Micrarchaeota archaeon]